MAYNIQRSLTSGFGEHKIITPEYAYDGYDSNLNGYKDTGYTFGLRLKTSSLLYSLPDFGYENRADFIFDGWDPVSFDIRLFFFDDRIVVIINNDWDNEYTYMHDFTVVTDVQVSVSDDILFYINGIAIPSLEFLGYGGDIQRCRFSVSMDETIDAGSGINWYEIAFYDQGALLPSDIEALSTYTGPTVPGPTILNSVFDIGEGKVTLSWTAPTPQIGHPVTGYNIYRSSSNNFWPDSDTLYETIGNYLTYEDNPESGNKYYYIVRAINNIGIGVETNEVVVKYPADLPSAPYEITIEQIEHDVSIEWQYPDQGYPIDNYKIYRDNHPSPTTLIATTFDDSPYYLDELPGVGTWYYKIVAVNALGDGTPSDEISIIVTTLIPWTYKYTPINTPDGYYQIYEDDFNRDGFNEIKRELSDGFLQTGNNSGSDYDYYYRYPNLYIDGHGHTIGFKVKSSGIIFGDLNKMYVSLYGDLEKNIYIYDDRIVVDIDGDEKTYMHDFTSDTDVIISVSIDTTEFYIDGILVPSLSYLIADYSYNISIQYSNEELSGVRTATWREISYYRHKNHIPSEMAVLETYTGPTVPEGVTDLAVTYDGTPGSEKMILTWTAPTDPVGHPITGYKIFRATDAGFNPNESYEIDEIGDVETYEDTSYETGETNYYVVRAICDLGVGIESNYDDEFAPLPLPSAPQYFGVNQPDGIELSWAGPLIGEPIYSYKIYRGTSPGVLTLLTTVSGVYFYADNEAQTGTWYYKISAVNSTGEGEFTTEISITYVPETILLSFNDVITDQIAPWLAANYTIESSETDGEGDGLCLFPNDEPDGMLGINRMIASKVATLRFERGAASFIKGHGSYRFKCVKYCSIDIRPFRVSTGFVGSGALISLNAQPQGGGSYGLYGISAYDQTPALKLNESYYGPNPETTWMEFWWRISLYGGTTYSLLVGIRAIHRNFGASWSVSSYITSPPGPYWWFSISKLVPDSEGHMDLFRMTKET